MAISELPSPDGLVLRPFRGVRFAVDDLAAVTSPPYDLITREDVRPLLDVHSNNVVRLILPGTDQQRYGEARETLLAWLRSGVLAVDEAPAVYVYEQSGPGLLLRGLIGDLALSDPTDGIVLPHEDVMPGTVADRLALMRTTESNLEPIFLLYDGDSATPEHNVDQVSPEHLTIDRPAATRPVIGQGGLGGGALARLVAETAARPPLVDVRTDDGIDHRLWALTDPADLAVVATGLRPHKALIADGHHRYATYLALQRDYHAQGRGAGPWDYGLALLVDSTAYPPQLKAIHRVIPGLPLKEAAARAKGSWQVHEHARLEDALAALATAEGPAFVLAGAGPSHLLTDPDPVQVAHAMPPSRSARWKSLSTSILSEFLLPKVWGLHDDERTVRIVHHDPLLAAQMARRESGTAVIVPSLTVEDVYAIAAVGERVPRKSTSFGPKPRTGLILRTFATD
ncbi:hypothetical protein Skr01_58960 [Sphaerisporangium krabiense]|uniref:Uncharacterized protein (DUF1015 family) n=1 Tax=Sphaerisporangium krabiense TaxID=763782 RepID=A0A7W8ZBL8_9ACTN|nr:DUF1015 domain-containing protein [Sphaerisporangium krabiense]MBB5630930.1 uncharacterized protein (DUF1015 family) [Sphaerisporangium krabiense]GII65811.1 hypothetical protein Skr01_58960 [Sphaerisporangium krabiense]